MAFDHDAKLFDMLAGGYHLNTKLQALLSLPLDSRGQEEAMAFSQELSRVFVVSMSMLNSNAVAPEIRTGNISGVSIPAKDQRARSDNGEVFTPSKKSREEGVTRKEITHSPHKDGYQWRKYGQKKIQNCNFSRYYYKCNSHRRCLAKKKVQQQDDGQLINLMLPPVFEVTYVNEHTCHVLRANDDHDAAAARMLVSPGTTNRARHHTALAGAARGGGGGDGDLFDLFPHIIGGGGGGSGSGSAEEEKDAIVSCLATVISGGAAPPPAAAGGDPAAAFVLPLAAGHSASGVANDDGAMDMMMVDDTGFSWAPSSSFCPVEEEAAHQHQVGRHRDARMGDVVGFADTVWPQHTCGAWRRA